MLKLNGLTRESIRYEERDGIALIGLCSLPVNGLVTSQT